MQFFIVPVGMGPTLITTGFPFVVYSECGFAGYFVVVVFL